MVGRARMAPAVLALICLAGCHAIPKGFKADDLKPGHGQVYRPVTVAIGPTLQATLAALDESNVKPKELMIHTLTEGLHQQGALGIEPESTNVAMVPTGARYDDIFVRHQMIKADGSATPFVPRFVTYSGETVDKRHVLITIATKRGEEANNLISVRVGATGDTAWSQTFLDKVAARTGTAPTTTAAPNPTLPN